MKPTLFSVFCLRVQKLIFFSTKWELNQRGWLFPFLQIRFYLIGLFLLADVLLLGGFFLQNRLDFWGTYIAVVFFFSWSLYFKAVCVALCLQRMGLANSENSAIDLIQLTKIWYFTKIFLVNKLIPGFLFWVYLGKLSWNKLPNKVKFIIAGGGSGTISIQGNSRTVLQLQDKEVLRSSISHANGFIHPKLSPTLDSLQHYSKYTPLQQKAVLSDLKVCITEDPYTFKRGVTICNKPMLEYGSPIPGGPENKFVIGPKEINIDMVPFPNTAPVLGMETLHIDTVSMHKAFLLAEAFMHRQIQAGLMPLHKLESMSMMHTANSVIEASITLKAFVELFHSLPEGYEIVLAKCAEEHPGDTIMGIRLKVIGQTIPVSVTREYALENWTNVHTFSIKCFDGTYFPGLRGSGAYDTRLALIGREVILGREHHLITHGVFDFSQGDPTCFNTFVKSTKGVLLEGHRAGLKNLPIVVVVPPKVTQTPLIILDSLD